MSVYEEVKDLYNFEETEEEYTPELTITELTIEDETIKGYTFQTPGELNVFAYSTDGTMGNHWHLYDIEHNRNLIIGRKTRRQIIEESRRL